MQEYGESQDCHCFTAIIIHPTYSQSLVTQESMRKVVNCRCGGGGVTSAGNRTFPISWERLSQVLVTYATQFQMVQSYTSALVLDIVRDWTLD